ncbi:hypothetical protein R3P38DRAFT_3215596 [Favolaschia claudopus]|uniref:Uncharacterized protein n=1 Tax=Favolaschia claudopus TaxID=2862362 RepID=A0AAW0A9U6_9AGAR
MSQRIVHAAAQSLRNVHTSNPTQAAVAGIQTSPAFADIFNVPSRLRRSGGIRANAASGQHCEFHVSPRSRTDLQVPLVYDGPAGRRPVLGRTKLVISSYVPQNGSAPVITVFDGRAHAGGRVQMEDDAS